MTQTAGMKTASTNLVKLEQVCRVIMEVAERTGTLMAVPIPLPVKRPTFSVDEITLRRRHEHSLKASDAEHRWLINLGITDQSVMRRMTRVQISGGAALLIF